MRSKQYEQQQQQQQSELFLCKRTSPHEVHTKQCRKIHWLRVQWHTHAAEILPHWLASSSIIMSNWRSYAATRIPPNYSLLVESRFSLVAEAWHLSASEYNQNMQRVLLIYRNRHGHTHERASECERSHGLCRRYTRRWILSLKCKQKCTPKKEKMQASCKQLKLLAIGLRCWCCWSCVVPHLSACHADDWVFDTGSCQLASGRESQFDMKSKALISNMN